MSVIVPIVRHCGEQHDAGEYLMLMGIICAVLLVAWGIAWVFTPRG